MSTPKSKPVTETTQGAHVDNDVVATPTKLGNEPSKKLDDFIKKAEAGENPEQYSPMQEEQNAFDKKNADAIPDENKTR